MNNAISSDIHELISAVHYRPAISIIIPFEPKMSLKHELQHHLKVITDKLDKQLASEYPKDIYLLIMRKLKAIIKDLNYNTHKKSIAIYVSPVFEKVLYLDVLVEEKIIIDDSFEIRDLVYSKKQLNKYLVLILSGNEFKIFLGNAHDFVRLVTNTPEQSIAYKLDTSERISNFSDMDERHDIELKKFLLQVDNSLNIILQAYPIPLFVLGVEKILGLFKKHSKHTVSIIDYIKGNYEAATIPELIKVIEPYKKDWNKLIEKNIINKIEAAHNNKKLVFGIRDVWKSATNKNGSLLIVEKNYMIAAEPTVGKKNIYMAIEPYNKFSYIKDAVDDVIEKILEAGGDVEFVEPGILESYNHIALIQYY